MAMVNAGCKNFAGVLAVRLCNCSPFALAAESNGKKKADTK